MTSVRTVSIPASLGEILELQAHDRPRSVAIGAPGRQPLTFERLFAHYRNVIAVLNQIGIGHRDRVALVLPNGPEMATAFLAVSCCATCAPLDPGGRAEEFDFYLSDLGVRAVIVSADVDSPVVAVAERRGILVLRLWSARETEAGIFSLASDGSTFRSIAPRAASLDDVALVLYTSGTTAKPKRVPLTHRNICASAENIRTALQLTPADRCLNVMPLFHIHGLIAAVVSSLSAGGTVVCPPAFHAAKFFEWMEEFQPTWYTAVPTIHQTILARASEYREIVERRRFRFIRSSSAALPPNVMSELERVFKTPVIEAYGMTEATHQMASNPLPPGTRKPGSVGVATGLEIATMDVAGRLLSTGETGEVVIRGANVTAGYEDNPAANDMAFCNGWFRTGDQGVIDAEGYLSLTGRLKEMINRGGEKISPREIDDVLMSHPAVAQAVTFATPHPTLGEDVAAAVVLRDTSAATTADIRKFASTKLADFKVPRVTVILAEIPKGPTGKIQRVGMAEKLSLANAGRSSGAPPAGVAQSAGPRDDVERRLVAIWQRVLALPTVSVNDDFFELGGYSILAAELVEEISREFTTGLSMATLLLASTVEQQARIVRDHLHAPAPKSLLPIKPDGSRPPFYFVHTVGGNILGYRPVARHLAADQPVYGFQSIGLDGEQPPLTSIEEMARGYVRELRAFQPRGPYSLGGQSFGGLVAFEMARQLETDGETVGVLALLDTIHVGQRGLGRARSGRWHRAARLRRQLVSHAGAALRGPDRRGYLRQRVRVVRRHLRNLVWRARFPQFARVQRANREAFNRFVPRPYGGRVTFFMASERMPGERCDPLEMWQPLATGGVDLYEVPGDHITISVEPNAAVLARLLQARLDAAHAP